MSVDSILWFREQELGFTFQGQRGTNTGLKIDKTLLHDHCNELEQQKQMTASHPTTGTCISQDQDMRTIQQWMVYVEKKYG